MARAGARALDAVAAHHFDRARAERVAHLRDELNEARVDGELLAAARGQELLERLFRLGKHAAARIDHIALEAQAAAHQRHVTAPARGARILAPAVALGFAAHRNAQIDLLFLGDAQASRERAVR